MEAASGARLVITAPHQVTWVSTIRDSPKSADTASVRQARPQSASSSRTNATVAARATAIMTTAATPQSRPKTR
jgi:hypothetical protein